MFGKLNGKVAVVTGAGARGIGWGIGQAIATLLARAGARLLIFDRDEAAANRTRESIEAEGGDAAIFVGDVTCSDDLRAMTNAAIEKFGRLDILVNNVGIHSKSGLFNISEEDWLLRFTANVTSAFVAAKHAVPHMVKQKNGRIINISSIAALRSSRVPGYAYGASKAALQRLTKDLALEFAPDGIRTNCIVVGMMDTPMSRAAYAEHGRTPEEVEAAMQTRDALVPTGKQGSAWDIAYAALFLASDEAHYVNGIDLIVDGGYTLLNSTPGSTSG